MTPESKLWHALKDKIPTQAHVQRIENTIERGTPDLNIFYMGKDYWIELKIEENSKLYLRKEQAVWAARRHMSGGTSYVIARNMKYDTYTLHQSPFVVEPYNGIEVRIVSAHRSLLYGEAGARELINDLLNDHSKG